MNFDNLDKYVKQIKDVCMKNQNGSYEILIAGTELNLEKSVGISNLEYIENALDTHDYDSIQGFLYLNVDDTILQGSELKVEYLYTGNNLSEIDRVSKRLDDIRLVGNDALKDQVQKTLDEMFEDGTVAKIAENYSDAGVPGSLITK